MIYILINYNYYFFGIFQNTYYYAVAFIDGYRSYPSPSTLRTAQKICGVIACTKSNDWKSCGQRHNSSAEVHKRFRIDRIELSTNLPLSNMTIIPNTVTMNLKSFQKFDWYGLVFIMYPRSVE